MNLLTVCGISKKLGNGVVLNNINFAQQVAQKIAIAGATGSGKSTLLKIIAGLIQPDAGEILFQNERVQGPDEKLIPGIKGIAYLSQHFELQNNYRVEEVLDMTNKMSDEDAGKIYKTCRITHLLKRKTDQLSGGEKQRIATAKLLITSPKLLLLDEPYSNLDVAHKNILKSVIKDISDELKITCILISHDPVDTLSWADEIIIMKDGEMIQKAPPLQVYRQPVDIYAATLFGKFNLLNSNLATKFLVALPLNNKYIFTRPEDFKIVSDEKRAITGEVRKVLFFGAYQEIDVMFDNALITVRDCEAKVTKGDIVYILFKQEEIWYL